MQLLDQEDLGELVNGHAANFLGKAEVHEASFAIGHGLLDADVMVVVSCPLGLFVEVAIRVLLCALDEKLLLVGKGEVHAFLRS